MVGVVLLAIPTVLVSASYASLSSVPERAAAIWPANGEALSRIAQAALIEGQVGGVRAKATRALQFEPATAQAIRTVALVGELEGEPAPKMAGLIDLSQQFSRRDLLTNLRLLEREVARGDIRGALVYYDRTLRTDASAERLLFPTLAKAANEPPIAIALSDLLARNPSWGIGFLQFAIASGTADSAFVPIALRLSQQPTGLRDDLKRYFITRLADRGKWHNAFTLYRAWSPLRATTSALAVVGSYPPLDWKLASRFEASATPTAEGGFVIEARSGAARVAERIIRLAPGRYRFDITSQVDNPAQALPVMLSIGCQDDTGKVLATQTVGAGASQSIGFDVPVGICTTQNLAFDLGSGDVGNNAPMRMTLIRLAIVKARPS